MSSKITNKIIIFIFLQYKFYLYVIGKIKESLTEREKQPKGKPPSAALLFLLYNDRF